MTPFVRQPYNYDMNAAGDESGLACKDPTLAQQQFADEVDIKTIVERFGLSGEVPVLQNPPSQGDFEGIFDFQTAMNAVVAAQKQFMTLPAKIRTRFENDPQQFVEFFNDDENRPEAERLGLVAPKPPEPVKVETKQGDTPKTPNVTQ